MRTCCFSLIYECYKKFLPALRNPQWQSFFIVYWRLFSPWFSLCDITVLKSYSHATVSLQKSSGSGFFHPKDFPLNILIQGNFGFAPSGSLNSILEFTRETEPIRVCVCVCIYVYFNIYLSSIYQSSTYLSIYLPMHLSGDLEVLVHRVAGTCKSKIHSPGQQVDTQAGLAAGFR